MFIAVIATAMLATGCSNSETVTPVSVSGEATITFNVINYEQVDFDAIQTRSTEVSNLKYLELGIYDATTKELTSTVLQENTDEDYGTFNVTIPYGSYTLVFIGWYTTQDVEADMSDLNAIVFTDNYVPHLFCETLDLTVDENTLESQSIRLSRVIAGFRVVISDEIPEDASYFHVTSEGGGYALDPLTGFAASLASRENDVTVLSSWAGQTDRNFNVYALLTQETAEMKFVVDAYDTSNNLMVSHTFTDVPMKINQLTRYTGNFFAIETSEGSFSVSLADDYSWENIDDHTFRFSD